MKYIYCLKCIFYYNFVIKYANSNTVGLVSQTYVTKKEPHNEALSKNGAADGMIPEPKFEIFSIINTDECRIIYIRIE